MTDLSTPEAVAFHLLELIIKHGQAGKYGKEELLSLFSECLMTVRGPAAEDLLAALGMED